MPGFPRLALPSCALALLLGLIGCASSKPQATPPRIVEVDITPAPRPPETPTKIMLGIDVLAAEGFASLKGQKIGLLTHPAGVNREGVSTVDILRNAPGVRLVALFGPEHGIYGNEKADVPVEDKIDTRTGLPVYSLYGPFRHPTKKMLEGLDTLVIDLQDIGTRSYTFVSCMRYAMESCFENGVAVMVLDRPNPLGGLKVDGPPLDPEYRSYVGAFRVPYVHGLTIGELARMAHQAPGVLAVSDDVRQAGKLTVMPMHGWRRSMRWPETGLEFVPTSPYVPDFAACVGYAMTGLGTYLGEFSHGVGKFYPFRGLSHKRLTNAQLAQALKTIQVAGVAFRPITVPRPDGRTGEGLYIEVYDWDAWQPTELSFRLMPLACRIEQGNPFAAAKPSVVDLFIKHEGSKAWYDAIAHDGANVDVDGFLARWREQAKVYQKQSQRYWLYL